MKNLWLVLLLGTTTLLLADFTRVNGVVTDIVTTLEWQDDYSDNAGNIKYTNWDDAITYCETLGLKGGGWRLPNIRELRSIVDYEINNPTLDSIFQNVVSNNYWSSTSYVIDTSNAWVVYFYDGELDYFNKPSSHYVRCVRAGQ